MSRWTTALILASIVIVAGCAGGGGTGGGAPPANGAGGGGGAAGGAPAGGGGGGGAAGGGGGGGAGGVGAAGSAGSGNGQLGYSVGGAKDVNNFRDNVEEGYLPLPTDMTYEGLFHDYYFDTGRSSRCEMLFCPAYSRAVTRDPLSDETEYYMTVGLNSGIDATDFERKKLNLVIVLDVSDSMNGAFDRYYYDGGERRESEERPKIEAAKQSVLALADHLREGDRFGLVMFNDEARTVVDPSPVSELDMEAVRGRIRDLEASGGTNFDAGMSLGSDLLRPYDGSDPDEYETRIVYVTDAMPNLGDTSAEGLGGALRRNADRGVYTTFVGVGVDFNTRLVESISGVRGANYYSVHSAADFEERMDEGFRYMVTPLVFDLELSLESEGYRIEQVYGSTAADGSTGRLMHVNTLFPSRTQAGRTKGGVVLLELERTGGADRVELSVSYENRAGEEFERTADVTFRDRDPEYFENAAIRKAVLLSRYADLVRGWASYERAKLAGESPGTPGDGIEPPRDRALGKWERESADLRVSSPYRDRFDRFASYFAEEAEAIGDDTLTRELDVLETLATYDGGDGRGEEGALAAPPPA